MFDCELLADNHNELQDVLYEELIEEINWAFAVEFEKINKES